MVSLLNLDYFYQIRWESEDIMFLGSLIYLEPDENGFPRLSTDDELKIKLIFLKNPTANITNSLILSESFLNVFYTGWTGDIFNLRILRNDGKKYYFKCLRKALFYLN